MDQKQIDAVRAATAQAYDDARPEAAAQAHAGGRLTARERLASLCDAGSFLEFGAQAEGEKSTPGSAPADGMVTGVARIVGLSAAVASQDYSVLRGTQSRINQSKLERLVFLAVEHRWPLVYFVDGEGERPQEPPGSFIQSGATGARIGLFDGLCEMSGWAPTVAVVSGVARDGNATLAMFADCVVGTAGSTLGAGEQRLAVEEHARRGDIDLVVKDEPAAIAAVHKYLSYLLSDRPSGEPSPAAQTIRSIVPDNRRRAYDMRKVILALADADGVLELRPNWGTSMITCLVRMGGRTVGLFANQPTSRLAGAIDSDAADKMARFIELCDAYDLPIISLIDSPGFHIGQEAEREGIARHHIRTLTAIHHRTVPLYCVQLRKAYGLGPVVMRGSGGRRPPELRLAWPTVETGGMSLEGAAYLVRRKEILAAKTPEEARAIRDDYANTVRDMQSGLRAGRNFSFDEIIDPAETRDRIIAMLRLSPRPARTGKKSYLDTI